MNITERNKRFFLGYWDALSGKKKTEELIKQYVSDEKLINHILFFEKAFPKYKMIAHEILAEDDRVFVRATFVAQHTGLMDHIAPTQQKIEAPFAVGYKIKNDMIVDFWAIGDRLELLEQLGMHGVVNTDLSRD